MQWKYAFFLFVSLLAPEVLARTMTREINEYLRTNYPHIDAALANKTYDDLRRIDGHLHVRHKFSRDAKRSFFNAILVGASAPRTGALPKMGITYSDLSFADFRNVDLREVNLAYSKLFGTQLKNAIISCEHIKGTRFAFNNLTNTKLVVDGKIIAATSETLAQCGAQVNENFRLTKHFLPTNKPWACPQQQQKENDPITNLFAENGALQKIDMVAGTESRAYEYENYRGNFDDDGYETAIVSMLLDQPKHDVTVQLYNGTIIHFTKHDIAGLLASVVTNIVGATEIATATTHSPMSPKAFYDAIHQFIDSDDPFIYRNIRADSHSYLIDEASIGVLDSSPKNTTFFSVELISHVPRETRLLFEGTFTVDPQTGEETGTWLSAAPGSIMRPHPRREISDKSIWTEKNYQYNPKVPAEWVYEIYMQSSRTSKILLDEWQILTGTPMHVCGKSK